jgi:hypothetical protein
VARAVCTLGKHTPPEYYTKPSAKAQKVQQQLERYPEVKVVEIEGALNEAAQQNLVSTDVRLVGVNAPAWLRIKKMAPKLLAPKPKFVKLD